MGIIIKLTQNTYTVFKVKGTTELSTLTFIQILFKVSTDIINSVPTEARASNR